MSVGRVYLVGAGPGDPGLFTLRGAQLLALADAVVYDRLVPPSLLDLCRPDAQRIYVGKRPDAHTLPQERINALLVELAREGKCVVRLKGGDPFVFGRGGEEAAELADAGIPFEVVPGVTAGIAAPAYAGIPVTDRRCAGAFALITGHETPDREGSLLDWGALAKFPGTLAFYMGVGRLAEICERLITAGRSPDTPAGVIEQGTTVRQRTVTGTLVTLPDAVREASIAPPAMIVVGEVVGLREHLAWFEKRPLFGQCIAVTRARQQAGPMIDQLRELGAEVLETPAIRIAPPEDPAPLAAAVHTACEGGFDWIVFTSVNAVDAFFTALAEPDASEAREPCKAISPTQSGGVADARDREPRCGARSTPPLDARALHRVRLCAIGPVTADRLRAYGLRADAVPARFVSTEIAPLLVTTGELRNQRVLLPRSDLAPPDLARALTARGARVTDVIAYRTLSDPGACAPLVERLAEGTVDWITFTSSSTVTHLLAAVGPDAVARSRARLASIGPTTSQTLRENGLCPAVEADPHTGAALVTAILEARMREATE